MFRTNSDPGSAWPYVNARPQIIALHACSACSSAGRHISDMSKHEQTSPQAARPEIIDVYIHHMPELHTYARVHSSTAASMCKCKSHPESFKPGWCLQEVPRHNKHPALPDVSKQPKGYLGSFSLRCRASCFKQPSDPWETSCWHDCRGMGHRVVLFKSPPSADVATSRRWRFLLPASCRLFIHCGQNVRC